MIAPCNFLAPNGEKSELAQSLIEEYGPKRAIDVWDVLHSDDVLSHIHDWKQDTRWNNKDGELVPEVAKYVHNIYTARNEWNKITSDAELGSMKLRKEYYQASAQQLVDIYEGAKMIASKDTYGRTLYKVTIPQPKFEDATADKIAAGEKDLGLFTHQLNTPGNYITPEIPEKEITPSLSRNDITSLAKGTTNTFLTALPPDMAIGEKAMLYANGKPMIATYDGKTDDGKAHQFSVSNPYTPAQIAHEELGLSKDTVVPNLASDSNQLQESLGRMFAQVRGEDGKPIEGKYFTPEQQNDAISAVLTDLYGGLRKSLRNGDTLTANLLLSKLRETQAKLSAFNNGLKDVVGGIAPDTFMWSDLESAEALSRSQEITNVLRSYDQIAGFTMERLRAYGFHISDNIRENITDYLNRTIQLTDEQNTLELPPDTIITGDEGAGLKDWADSPFELDPRDTASKSMKFFLATIKDAEFGTEEAPKRVQMIFSDPALISKIVKGTKVYTARTPEQAQRIKLGTDGRGSVVLDGKTFAVEEHKILEDEQSLESWTDVFREEKLEPEVGSTIYKISEFKPKENVLVNKRSAMGFPRLAPFDQVFTDLLARVQDAQDISYDGFIDALTKSGSPTMLRVVQELNSSDQSQKNEFYKVFSKQYYRMRIMLFNNRQVNGEEVTQGNLINANRYNEIDTLINGWREQQKISPIITEQAGKYGVDTKLANQHLEQFKRITAFDWNRATSEQMTKLRDWTYKFLNDIGITISPEAIRDLQSNAERLTKGTQFAGSWLKQFSITADGKPNGLIAALALRLNGLATPESQVDEGVDIEQDFIQNNNPLYTENTALRILAKSQAKFSPSLFTDMHKNSEGKNIYSYGLHTYESHTFNSLKNDERFREQYATTPFAARSWLLGRLRSAEQRNQIELNYLDGIKASYRRGGGTTRPDMSPREQELTAVLSFLNRGNKYATFFDLTKSDKSTTPVIVNVEKFPVKSFTLSQDMSKALNDVFESEFARVKHWEDNKDSFNNRNYKDGGGLFYMLPQFNFEEMQRDYKSGRISKDEFYSVWSDDGSISRSEDTVTRTQVASKYVDTFVKDMARQTRERWRGMGLFDNERTWLDQSWIKKAMGSLFIFRAPDKGPNGEVLYNKFENGQLRPISRAGVNELTASLAALEYSTHYFLHNTSMAQLISGDPALAYKGKAGDSQVKQVSDTMQEYQKRLAKDIGPGSDPQWGTNTKYKSLTIADPNYNSYLGEFLPGYRDLDTAADAQELTTTQEHIDVMYAQGLVPDKTHHEMSDIIKGAKAGYYEFTKPEHLDIVLQAQKPVQVGNDFNNGVMEIHYVKTSSYPLLPQLTAGKEIDRLRQHMEAEGIQRAVFKSGKKLGAPEQTAQVFDGDGKFIGHPDSITKATQVLDRSGFRIQQEIPYDETKGKILTVSQMNKLIVEGIEPIQDFAMPNHEWEGAEGTTPAPKLMSGTDIKALKEQTRINMFNIQRRAMLKSVGATESEDGYSFSGKHEKLFKALENEAISRNYPPNDLEAIRTRLSSNTLVLPLFLNGSADRFESLMMSMVKKNVALQQPGKSFIQASSLGFKGHMLDTDLSSEQKKGIIYIEGFDSSQNLRSMQKGGKPAQVMVPFDFLSREGKVMDISKFTKVTEDGRTVIDSGKLPDELRRFVGARIPNQEHSSMLPIEIVGFIPKQLGDLMIVPAEITKQMGSDFDVDKLYVYRPNYTHDQTTGVLSPQDMKVDPESHMNMKQLQQQYFDIHWSILTHPDMFNRVNEPLDKPELKNEKALAEARLKGKGISNYFTANQQMDDFQSQKDAKTLVGATAVNNTFNAVIQDKELRLGHHEITDSGELREVADYIDVLDEVTGDTLKLNKLSGYGKSQYYEKENPTKDDVGVIRSKGNNISTQLSEVVDHSKNRTIDAINLNQYTFPASAATTLLETKDGKALNLKYNSRLIQQQSVRDFVDRMAIGNDSLSTNFESNLKDKIFAALLDEYAARAGDGFDPEKKILFSPQSLLRLLNTPEGKKDAGYYANQYHALELFRRFTEIGDVMRQIQSKFNQDTRGAGPDLLASLNTQSDLPDTFGNGKVLGVESMAGNLDQKTGILHANTEAGHTYKNTIEVANGLYPELLPYHKIQPLYGSISVEMGRDKITVDNQRRIADAVRSNLFADARNGLFENASSERARLLFDTDAGPSLARRVAEAQRGEGKGNYFITRLATHLATTDGEASTLTYNATGASSLDDFEITKAWAGLLTSANPEQRALGEDLLRYTYATGGMQTAQNFAKFAPIGYIAGLPMARELNTRVNTIERSATGLEGGALEQQIFQHNPDMAMQMKADFTQTREYDKTPERIPESFTLFKDVTNTEHPAAALMIKAVDEYGKPTMRYPDYLTARSPNGQLLYKRMTEGDGYTGYQRIDTLGKGDVLEYDPSRNYARSIFPENRALNPLHKTADADMARTPAEQVWDINQQSNTAKELGLDSKDATLNDVVDSMMVHPDISDGASEVLNELRNLASETSQVVGSQKLPTVEISPELGALGARGAFSYDLSESKPGSNNLDYKNPKIEISPSGVSTPERAAETLIHELTHYNTALVLRGYERWKGGDAERPAWLTDSMFDSIRTIEDMRDAVAKQLPMQSPALRYALGSTDEFISGVMHNRELQDTLNNMPSTEDSSKSLLGRIIDGIRNIIEAISDYLGRPVVAGSMLEDALMHSATIMGAHVEGDSVGARIRSLGESTDLGPESHQLPGFDDLEPETENSPEIQKAVGNLTRLLGDIKARHILPTNRMTEEAAKEYHLQGQEIARLEYEIGKLNAAGTLHNLVKIGERQMKSIDAMLAGDRKLSTKQLENLLDTANTWEHTVDELYASVVNGDVPKEAQILRGQAAERKAKIVNLVKEYEIQDPTSVINNYDDFNAEQMKVGGFTAYTADLSRTSSMVAQQIDKYLKTASRLHVEEMRRTRKEISDYQAKLNAYAKSKGTTPQKVFDSLMQQRDKWGMVNIFSSDYYSFKGRVRSTLHAKLDIADKIDDPVTRLSAIREAYKSYREDINKNVVYVDTSRIFDDQTGDLLDTPEAAKHREKLEKELGPELAQTMIDRAKSQFEGYLRDRYAYKTAKTEEVRAQLDDFDDELTNNKGMTDDERIDAYEKMKTSLTKTFNEDYNEWEGHNSPNVFFRSMRGEYRGFNPKFQNFDAIVDAPRKDVVGKDGKNPFYDERFKVVQQDPQLRDIYGFIQDKMEQFKAMLPAHVTGDLYDNFLPIVEKELKLGIKPSQIKAKVGEVLTNALSSDQHSIDYSRMDTGMIPIRYTSPHNVEVKNRERDIFLLLEKFGNMAIHYKRATEVQSGVELLHQIMVDQISSTKGGQFDRINSSTKHLSDMVSYAKDRLLYQKGRLAEGEYGKLYSLNPVKQYKTEREVTNLRKQLEDLDTKYAEGHLDPEEYSLAKSILNKKIDEIPHSQLLLSKLGDTMIRFTELKTLSYNPFSAFANLSFGLVSLLNYANGQVDFNKRAAYEAFAATLQATKRAVTFGAADNATAKKILALMERYNTMGDLLDSDYAGGSRIQNKKTLGQKLASPYQLLRNSDYFMKGTILVAMLKTQKITIDGKEMSLWEAYGTDGKLKGDVKEWESEHPEEETEFLKFQAKAIQVSKVIMGNQDHASPMMIKKSSIGRLIAQFRATWLPEGINSRFSEERFDSQLGRDVKGRYNTYKDLGAIGSVITLARQAFSVFTKIDPFTRKNRDGSDLKPVDIENMRRNFSEIATYMTVFATVVALKMQLEKDDDDSPEAKRNRAFGRTLINLIVRNKQDMDYYASPDLFTNLSSSLIPALKVWTDFKRATTGTIKYIGQDASTATNPIKGSTVTEKWMRAIPYTSLYPKFHTMWSKDMDQLNN